MLLPDALSLDADSVAESAPGFELVLDAGRVTTRGLATLGHPELSVEAAAPAAIVQAQELLRDLAVGVVSCAWKLDAGDVLEDGRGGVFRLRLARDGTLEVERGGEAGRSTPEADRGGAAPASR